MNIRVDSITYECNFVLIGTSQDDVVIEALRHCRDDPYMDSDELDVMSMLLEALSPEHLNPQYVPVNDLELLRITIRLL